jgi:hypothetical protein
METISVARSERAAVGVVLEEHAPVDAVARQSAATAVRAQCAGDGVCVLLLPLMCGTVVLSRKALPTDSVFTQVK